VGGLINSYRKKSTAMRYQNMRQHIITTGAVQFQYFNHTGLAPEFSKQEVENKKETPLHTVYALTSTRSLGTIYYVGVTIRTLNKRLSKHFSDARRGETQRDNWIRSETAQGFQIKIMELVFGIPSKQIGYQVEIRMIKECSERGQPLQNGTKGGPGLLGYKQSEKSIRSRTDAIKNKKQPKEQVQKRMESSRKNRETRVLLYGAPTAIPQPEIHALSPADSSSTEPKSPDARKGYLPTYPGNSFDSH